MEVYIKWKIIMWGGYIYIYITIRRHINISYAVIKTWADKICSVECRVKRKGKKLTILNTFVHMIILHLLEPPLK